MQNYNAICKMAMKNVHFSLHLCNVWCKWKL